MTERLYGEQTTTERRAQRNQRIREAALEGFGTAGYRASSIERICTEANVSTRSLYEEFGGREELLIALHDDLNERALAAVLEAVGEIPREDLEARARAGLRAYFGVMTSDRRWARIALVETIGVSPTAEAARRAAIDRFAEFLTLEAAQLADVGVIAKRDYSLTAVAIVGSIYGLINTWTGEPDWESQVDQVIEEAVAVLIAILTTGRG